MASIFMIDVKQIFSVLLPMKNFSALKLQLLRCDEVKNITSWTLCHNYC